MMKSILHGNFKSTTKSSIFSDLFLANSQKPKSQRQKVKKVNREKFWNEKKKFIQENKESQTIYILYMKTYYLWVSDSQSYLVKEKEKKTQVNKKL